MSALAVWVLVGCAAWLVLAAIVAPVMGKVIRNHARPR